MKGRTERNKTKHKDWDPWSLGSEPEVREHLKRSGTQRCCGTLGKKKFGEKPRQNLGSTGLQYTLGETYSTPEQTLATLQVILLTANPAGASTPRMLLQSTVRMRAVFTVSHKIRPWLLVIIKEQYF